MNTATKDTAIAATRAATALAHRKCGGEFSRLSEEDARFCGEIDLYLSRLCGRSGEGAGRRCLQD